MEKEEVHKDWALAVKAGKQALCHFRICRAVHQGVLDWGNVALRVGHRIEWDPLRVSRDELSRSQPISLSRVPPRVGP